MLQIEIEGVGNSLQIVPPVKSHGRFLLTCVSARYESLPPTGARDVHIGVFDASGAQIMASKSSATQPVNKARWYYCFSSSPYQSNAASGGDENWMPWPVEFLVPPGGVVRVWDDNNISSNDKIRLIVQGKWDD